MKDEEHPSKTSKLRRQALPLILLASLVLFYLTDGHTLLSLNKLAEHYSSLKSFVSEHMIIALVAFASTYILTVALCLPFASLLTLAGGALLGWAGAIVVICAATIGASIVFIAAQTLMHEFFTRRTSGFLANLESGFHKNAFSYLLALRLIPLAPFWVVNIIPAIFGMRLKHYVSATFIGITPGTLIYVWVARSFDSLLTRGESPDLSMLSEPSIIMPLCSFGLLSLVPVLWKRAKHG